MIKHFNVSDGEMVAVDGGSGRGADGGWRSKSQPGPVEMAGIGGSRSTASGRTTDS